MNGTSRDADLKEKHESLVSHLRQMGSVAVAFSGGVDSTYLAAAAFEALGEKSCAVTIDTPYIPRWELEEARSLAKSIGISLREIRVGIDKRIAANPKDRCYSCKSALFRRIQAEATSLGLAYVVDGTNADDLHDYRPGLRALKELGILSPLAELGITKDHIRRLSRDMGLPTWDKPAYACLLTRIPHDRHIDEQELRRIEQAELVLMRRGIRAVRVRSHGELARIEVDRNERRRFFDETCMDEIAAELHDLGYSYVTLDLAGYRPSGVETARRTAGEPGKEAGDDR